MTLYSLPYLHNYVESKLIVIISVNVFTKYIKFMFLVNTSKQLLKHLTRFEVVTILNIVLGIVFVL
jgi:hypothetical protein